MMGQTAWSCKTSGNTFDGYTKVASATSGSPIWRIDNNMGFNQSVKRLTIKINSNKDIFISGSAYEWCQVAIDSRLYWLKLYDDRVFRITTKEMEDVSVNSFLKLLKSGNDLQMRIILPPQNHFDRVEAGLTNEEWSPSGINPVTGKMWGAMAKGGAITPIADFRFSLKNSGASIDCAIK